MHKFLRLPSRHVLPFVNLIKEAFKCVSRTFRKLFTDVNGIGVRKIDNDNECVIFSHTECTEHPSTSARFQTTIPSIFRFAPRWGKKSSPFWGRNCRTVKWGFQVSRSALERFLSKLLENWKIPREISSLLYSS